MDFTPSKKPFVENSLREVYILRQELEQEKMKTKQIGETLRKVIDSSELPTDQFRWYKLLGGNTMRKTRRLKRGGQPAPSTPNIFGLAMPTPGGPVTSWTSSPIGLPGAIGMPSEPPRLRRADADIVRRLDFEHEQVMPTPGCVPISKRLPGHRNDQCERSDHADHLDRAMCKQPGEGQVHSLDECGPVRGGKRKTRKTKKSTRRRRHSRRH